MASLESKSCSTMPVLVFQLELLVSSLARIPSLKYTVHPRPCHKTIPFPPPHTSFFKSYSSILQIYNLLLQLFLAFTYTKIFITEEICPEFPPVSFCVNFATIFTIAHFPCYISCFL